MKRIKSFFQSVHPIVMISVLLIISGSCVQTEKTGKNFAEINLDTFHEFKLKNGIPVVVKTEQHSHIKALVLVLRGGKKLVPVQKAGLDKLTLRLVTMESEKYSDVKRRVLLKKTSASISAGDGLDYSSYSLKTIDKYFDQTFDLYSDLFLHPVFSEKFFNETVINLKNKHKSDLTDGYSRVSFALNNTFFADHPYSSYLFNTGTLDNISLDDVKQFYLNNYVASRIALFAVGDFDVDALKEKLEGSFGSVVYGKNISSTGAQPFNVTDQSPLILDPYPDLKKETAYVRTNFSTIPLTHDDYMSLVIASNIVSDILTDLVRTKNSMVYSVWSSISLKKSNYGSISAYRTNNPVKVVELIRKSIDIAASGKCVSPFTGTDRNDDYVPIQDGLEFYKASFFTGFYSSLQTNSSIAMQMADSYMMAGDYTRYLRVMDEIKVVSAADVKKAVIEYIKKPAKLWAVTAHPETIELLKEKHRVYSSTVKVIELK